MKIKILKHTVLVGFLLNSCIFFNEKTDVRVYKIENTTDFNDSLAIAYINFENGVQKMFVINKKKKRKPVGGDPDLSMFTTKKYVSNDSIYFVFEYSSSYHRDSVQGIKVDNNSKINSTWYEPNQLIAHERIMLNYGEVCLLGRDSIMHLDGSLNKKYSYNDLFGSSISPVKEAYISNDSLRVYIRDEVLDSVCIYLNHNGNLLNLCEYFDDPTFEELGNTLWNNALIYQKFEGNILINYRYKFNFESQSVTKSKDTSEIAAIFSNLNEINYGDSVIYIPEDFDYP